MSECRWRWTYWAGGRRSYQAGMGGASSRDRVPRRITEENLPPPGDLNVYDEDVAYTPEASVSAGVGQPIWTPPPEGRSDWGWREQLRHLPLPGLPVVVAAALTSVRDGVYDFIDDVRTSF